MDVEQFNKQKLKRNNKICTGLFLVYGAGLYYACIRVVNLIIESGLKYKVPEVDITIATKPITSEGG